MWDMSRKFSVILFAFFAVAMFHLGASNVDIQCKPPRCVAKTFTNSVDGIKIAAEDWGASKPHKDKLPAILFLPGFPHDQTIWYPQIRSQLFAKYRLITMNWRGFGDSQPITDASLYNVPAIAEDIDNVIKGFNVQGPLILVGHSAGTIMMTFYLSEYGQGKIAGIAYVSGTYDQPTESPLFKPGIVDLLIAGTVAGLQGDTQGFIDSNKEFLNLSFEEHLPKPYFDSILKGDLKGAPISRLSLFTSPGATVSMLGTVQHITVPVIAIVGEKDQVFYSDQIAQSIVDAFTSTHVQVAAFPAAGHLVSIDEAQQFNQVLKRFADASVK